MTVLIVGGAAFTALLVALQGNHRPDDTIALGNAWLDELRTPRRIIAHRIKSRATNAAKSVEGWSTLEQVEIIPPTPEGKALSDLFRKKKLHPSVVTVKRCEEFDPDFALEFIASAGKRVALFDFGCPQVTGDSGIKDFDLRALGAFASTVFPREQSYLRVGVEPDE